MPRKELRLPKAPLVWVEHFPPAMRHGLIREAPREQDDDQEDDHAYSSGDTHRTRHTSPQISPSISQ